MGQMPLESLAVDRALIRCAPPGRSRSNPLSGTPQLTSWAAVPRTYNQSAAPDERGLRLGGTTRFRVVSPLGLVDYKHKLELTEKVDRRARAIEEGAPGEISSIAEEIMFPGPWISDEDLAVINRRVAQWCLGELTYPV